MHNLCGSQHNTIETPTHRARFAIAFVDFSFRLTAYMHAACKYMRICYSRHRNVPIS